MKAKDPKQRLFFFIALRDRHDLISLELRPIAFRLKRYLEAEAEVESENNELKLISVQALFI